LVTGVPAKSKKVFAELEGPGCIRHIWMTDSRVDRDDRNAILRIYFDGAKTPQVEAPLRDFFGAMHGKAWYPLDTPLLSIQAKSGYNCYFLMPFAKSARMEIEAGPLDHRAYIQLDWHQYPGQTMTENRRFCTRWRREFPTRRYDEDYLMLDADGPGQLIGFVYGLRLLDNVDRWSHGGADNIYIDGQGDHPAYLRGIGGEDTFGTSYGGSLHPPASRLYASMPHYEQIDDHTARPSKNITGVRWFGPDAVHFQESLQLRFGCMENDICSTVYWYQEPPVRTFFRMPPYEKRTANLTDNLLPRGTYDLPLPNSGGWAITGPLPNEENQAIDSAAKGTLKVEDSAWKPRRAEHGFVDFGRVWRPHKRGAGVYHEGVVAVARARLQASEATTATLQLAWDDHLVLRVNGKAHDLGQQNNFQDQQIEVPLKHGDNQVELTLSNTQGFTHGAWAFAFKATTKDGKRLLPAPATPADRR